MRKNNVAFNTMNGHVWYSGGPIDEFGNTVTRTKQSHPYSYDGFIQWRDGENDEVTSDVYTDRLLQQDWEKYNELCREHFGDEGQYWGQRSPEKIQAFMRDWTGDQDLKLVYIMEYCNWGNGYPTWRLAYAQE